MDKYEYFEFRYSQSNDRCIGEMGELPSYYDNFQMKNMCEYFFEIGFEMRSNKLKDLEAKNKQLEGENKKLRDCVEDCLYSTVMCDPQIYSHKQACDYIREKTSLLLKELTTNKESEK